MNQSEKNMMMIKYLMECPDIQSGKLFLNFAEEDNESNHVVMMADDVSAQQPFIDGSVMKAFTFQIICYRTLIANPLIPDTKYSDENIENMEEVQRIIDWINEQERLSNYPDFGDDVIPERIGCLTTDPNLYAINAETDPPLAKYAIVIRYLYLDLTNRNWIDKERS